MKAIKGLIVKDLLNLQKYAKVMVVTLALMSFYGLMGEGFEFLIYMMPVMVIGMASLSTFNYDELARADRFVLTLPTSRKEVVRARYLLMMGVTAGAAILAGVMAVVMSLVAKKSPPDMVTVAFNAVVAFLMLAFMESVQAPCMYKWGAEQGRTTMKVVSIIILALAAGGYFLLQQAGLSFGGLSALPGTARVLMLLLLAVILYYISYVISDKIYQKKEL